MADDLRTHPPRLADDRTSLLAFLDYQRATLAMKCAGLSGEQLRRKAVPTSGLTLLGLVRHLATIEQSWFRLVVNGEAVTAPWPGEADGTQAEFHVEDADVDEAFEVWRKECARARDIVASFDSLDATVEIGGAAFSLRYVLTHMIEEYARHNGHADLLREAIDGEVGE
ncbi:DinB family protein [Streptomyces sp. NPDC048172]|uniref:DinB family protein n=1 Tax=Streptomyces sp. NPDC048172 TaxID=3365505 RepID=UPI003719BA26